MHVHLTFFFLFFLFLSLQLFQERHQSSLIRSTICQQLTLLHSERPKLYAILAFQSAIGLKEIIP